MPDGVVFRVLGPLEVVVRGGPPIPLCGGKLRVLLAVLLLHANRTVSIDELAAALWDGGSPAHPRSTIQKYVMRLRSTLQATGCPIHTKPEGYRIELAAGQLDLDRFNEQLTLGLEEAQRGALAAASVHLTEALATWRSAPPLSNVVSDTLHRDEVSCLVERYLHALEARTDVDMKLGRHSVLCEELMGLVRRYPLREVFWAQWMVALQAVGRQGEALTAYQEVTHLLSDELGVVPGPQLRAAHDRILRGSQEPPLVEPPMEMAPVAARQMPMATAGLVGRSAQIAQIVALLGADAEPGEPRLAFITGVAGVGKTTTAVHAAHRLGEDFPDGQLFADLEGSCGSAARHIENTLPHFLRSLGMPAAAIPSRKQDMIAAYRTLTADKRFLIVLDDAYPDAAVRDLLPGGVTSCVIVTSRHEFPDLLITPGARRLSLPALSPGDANTVLWRMIGSDRIEREPDAANELISLCGGIPLTLRVAAAYLATQPQLPISAYVNEIRAGALATNCAPSNIRESVFEKERRACVTSPPG